MDAPLHQPSVPASVAIVGATGAVGQELVKCLEDRDFPVDRLKLLASPRSAGRTYPFKGAPVTVEAVSAEAFEGVDFAFFAAGATVSREFAPLATQAGALVIDNTSAFRMEPSIPLVVPEVNAELLGAASRIIANPNCVAAISAVPLAELARISPLKRLIMATYQSASGAGAAAMEELERATRAALDGEPFEQKVMPHPYAFNIFSHNSAIEADTGYNGEETKVMAELRKILGVPELPVSATCIRVPVLRAHSMAVTAEFERPISPAEAREALAKGRGLKLVDDAATNHYPMPNEASGIADVLVGRIRTDLSDPSGRTLSFFCAGDQLLKGAALNAVQIAEAILDAQKAS